MAAIVINTIDKLINCLELQQANLPTYQAAVGATAGDLTAVADALANLIQIRDYSELVDANKKVVFQIKQVLFNGATTETVPAFPIFPDGDLPATIRAGELELAMNRNKRFRLGPGYTEDIGVALGIETVGPLAPEIEPKPVIDVFAAQTGYTFSTVVTNRGAADSWHAQILRAGSATWQTVGTFTGKSADVTIPPTTPGQPEQVQVRVQLRKNNANYGVVSDASYVTVNP